MDQRKHIPQKPLVGNLSGPADNNEEIKISFQPVTQGLGFHPFSDGLPYAPTSKPKSAHQIIAPAGPPKFTHRAEVNPALVEAPQLGGLLHPRAQVPFGSPHSSSTNSVASSVQSRVDRPVIGHSVAQVALQAKVQPAVKFGFLYLVKRVLAYCLDFIFNSLFFWGILFGAFWFHELDPKILLDTNIVIVGVSVLLALNWFFITLQEVFFKTSMGKYFFHLVLTGGRVKIFFRSVFFLFSVALCGFGLLWSLFDRKKCCLHDRIFGIQPVQVLHL